MNQIERFAQLQRQNREQQLIFERMNEASATSYASVIKSTLTAPTEKMIQEYNAKNQQVPVVINDPETGEPTKFKFHPVEIEPELEAEEPDIDQQKAIYDAQEYMDMINTELPKLQKEYRRVNDQHIELRALYDSGDITEYEFNDDRDVLDLNLGRLEVVIQQFEAEIPLINAQIIQNLQEIELIKGRNMVIRETNKDKNKLLFDELNRLNSGAFNMAQLPYETEEEYKRRLISHSQIETPDQVLYDASIFAQKDFRSHLRELLNDESIIESVTNSFTPQKLSKLLGRWGAIQKRWLEIFGKNNEYTTVDEIITFLQNPTTNSEFESTVLAKKLNAPKNAIVDYSVAGYEVDELPDNILKIRKVENPNALYFQVVYIKGSPNLRYRTDDQKFQNINAKRVASDASRLDISGSAFSQITGATSFSESKLLTGLRGTHPALFDISGPSLPKAGPEYQEMQEARHGKKIKERLPMLLSMTNPSEKRATLTQSGDPVYIKIVGVQGGTSKKPRLLRSDVVFSSTGEKNSYYALKGKSLAQFLEQQGVNSIDFISYFKLSGLDDPNMKDRIMFKEQIQPEVDDVIQEGTVLGYGIKNKLPKKIEFGALTINSGKLWDEHILSVRDGNGYMVHGIPSSKISNEFVEIILKIVKGEKITQHEIKSLKLGERELYDLLLEKAKIIKELPNTKSDTIAELRTKFNVLQGEYEAGNTNTELVSDIIKIAKKLHMLKVITGKQLKEFVTQFN